VPCHNRAYARSLRLKVETVQLQRPDNSRSVCAQRTREFRPVPVLGFPWQSKHPQLAGGRGDESLLQRRVRHGARRTPVRAAVSRMSVGVALSRRARAAGVQCPLEALFLTLIAQAPVVGRPPPVESAPGLPRTRTCRSTMSTARRQPRHHQPASHCCASAVGTNIEQSPRATI